MMVRKVLIAIVALCLASAICFFTLSRYYILYSGKRTSDPELVMYRLDEVHRLLVGSDAALLINTQERVVVSRPPGLGGTVGGPRSTIFM
jgi:hypothetical protein